MKHGRKRKKCQGTPLRKTLSELRVFLGVVWTEALGTRTKKEGLGRSRALSRVSGSEWILQKKIGDRRGSRHSPPKGNWEDEGGQTKGRAHVFFSLC